MHLKNLVVTFFTGCLLLFACSKKQQPQVNAISPVEEVEKSVVEKPAVVKPVRSKKIYSPVPKVLTIYGGMQKSVDGRLYYDLEGRRYWKNYDDGKYYLFNKGMFSDAAFKPH